MDSQVSAFASHMAKGAPPPAARFTGFAEYYFIGGNNDPTQIPTEMLAKAAETVIKRDGHLIAIYNMGLGPLGYPPLRKFVADKMQRHRGVTADAANILITTGSNQGIDLVVAAMLNPGDVVVLEEHCYSSSISRFKKSGAVIVPVKLDDDGIVMDDLARILAEQKAKGAPVKMIYTIPTIQNPTGSILPMDRRHRMVELARQFDTIIFEDECYADLIWAGGGPPALYSLAPDRVVHIGSFSKTLAPALRLGYATGDWEIIGRMAALKSDGGTGALDQMIASEYFTTYFDEHVESLTAVLKDKLDCMVEAVEAEFGTHMTLFKPKGGIFLWMKLPDAVDVRKLIAPAAKAGIVFNPGPEWSLLGDGAKSHLRLCFALNSKENIREGVAKFAKVCFEETGIPPRSRNVTNTAG
ncbi:MAG: PLP-dependent aminotransferase family protein [Acetobacteraceae bacterium]|nr:PLP-dependent aminotransferase family protein [Acetobacteraceae bacterium]